VIASNSSQSLTTQSKNLKKRDLAIRYAVLTGLLSKGGGVILQLVAMPFAIRQIGLVAFGEYATALAAFSWVLLGETVVGQAMVRRIVASIRNKDASSVTSAIYTGLATVGFLAVIAAVLFCTVFIAWAIIEKRAIEEEVLKLYLAAGLTAVFKLFLTVTARARSAFQQTHVDNSYNALANIVSLAAVFLLLPVWPTPLTLLLALFLPPLAAQMVSAIQMFITNPLLWGAFRVDITAAREFLSESWWLLLGQIGTMCERQLPLVVFSLASFPAEAGLYAIAMQLLLMAASPLVMITSPLMPAIADAMHSNDHHWWSRRVRVLDRIITAGGCITMVLAFFQGSAFLHLLFGSKAVLSAFACAALVGWIVTILSALIYFTVLMAKGEARLLGKTLCMQGCIFALLSAPAFLLLGVGGLFSLGMILAVFITREPWRRRVVAFERYCQKGISPSATCRV
jgi:O-antigen/teichoic acid export membrane protein